MREIYKRERKEKEMRESKKTRERKSERATRFWGNRVWKSVWKRISCICLWDTGIHACKPCGWKNISHPQRVRVWMCVCVCGGGCTVWVYVQCECVSFQVHHFPFSLTGQQKGEQKRKSMKPGAWQHTTSLHEGNSTWTSNETLLHDVILWRIWQKSTLTLMPAHSRRTVTLTCTHAGCQ